MGLKLGAVLAGVVLAGAGSVAAHHSVTAEYDPDKAITITGTVTRVEWTNPHSRLYVDVRQPDGSVVNWNLELTARSALVRQGWTGRTVKVGDVVTAEGIGARTNVAGANARAVTLADGRKVLSGINEDR